MNPRSFPTHRQLTGDFNGDGVVDGADVFARPHGTHAGSGFLGGTWVAIGLIPPAYRGARTR